MLYDVINYYRDRGLTNYGGYEEFNSTFSFSSFGDIHNYLASLPFDHEHWRNLIYDEGFSDLELDYIKAISNNNNSFGASFLAEFLPGNVSYDFREGLNVCTIDKEKERILHKRGGTPPSYSYDVNGVCTPSNWYTDSGWIKSEWLLSPEFYKNCHDSETRFSLPMPIYINAVNRQYQNGFLSLYDDLSIVSRFLGVIDISFNDKKKEREYYTNLGVSPPPSGKVTIEGFIKDLSKLEGKVYFSYHDLSLTQVINARSTPYLENCCLHFFHIREPITNSNVKVCEGFSFQHVGF